MEFVRWSRSIDGNVWQCCAILRWISSKGRDGAGLSLPPSEPGGCSFGTDPAGVPVPRAWGRGQGRAWDRTEPRTEPGAGDRTEPGAGQSPGQSPGQSSELAAGQSLPFADRTCPAGLFFIPGLFSAAQPNKVKWLRCFPAP